MTTTKRTIDTTTANALRAQRVYPFHLMDLDLPTGMVFLSEGPQMSFDNGTGSHTYLAGRFQVTDVNWSPEGEQACSIELYNEDGVATTWFMQNSMANATVTLYFLYQTADGSFTVPVKYAVGSCDSMELTPDSLKVQLLTLSKERKFFPNTYIGSVGFNHLPQERSVVFWNNTTHVLELDYD